MSGELTEKSWHNWMARAGVVLGWAYLVVLLVWVVCLRAIGEHSALTALGIFAPIGIWLVPVPFLAGFSLFAGRKLLILSSVAVLMVFFGLGRFQIGGLCSKSGGKPSLRVMTNNVGQNNRRPIVPFVDANQPDIILIQEAQYGAGGYVRTFPDRHVAGRGQFLVLSKFPVVKWEPVATLLWHGAPVAARFEIEANGRKLVLYNVHLPTPRYDFLRFSPRELAVDVLDPSTPDAKPVHLGLRATMEERVRLGRELIALAEKEGQPTVIAGDFNMPDTGRLYPLFAEKFSDAFASAGFGYGYTFPGFTRNPVSLFQPWLRLDYIFVNRGLKPVSCEVESKRPSQHRAVLATLEWQ